MATHTENLYSALTNEGFEVGDSASFVEAMKSPERRAKLYASAKEQGLDLGDPAEFDAKIASDFQAPEPTPQAPAAPAEPRDAKRIRELLSSGSWTPKKDLDPAASGGPILSAAPASSSQKQRAEANDEIDRMFQAALARGEKYLSVEDYVKRNLTGEKRAPELVEDPGAVISGAFSGLRRSKMWRPIETAAKIPINALLVPERIAPATGESILSKANELVSSDLFGNLQTQADDVEKARARAAVDRVNQEAGGASPLADATAAPVMRQAPEPGVMESFSNLAAQFKESPRQTTADLLGSMVTPENVAAEALTGNAALGALSKVARSTRMGAKAARLMGNPLVEAGLPGGSLLPGIIRETAQGVGAEFLGTGDVTAQGVVENLIPAAAGTPIMRGVERMLTRKPKMAIAPGGETIGAAPRTATMEPPPSAPEPPAAPEPTQTQAPAPEAPQVQPEPPAAPTPELASAPVQDMNTIAQARKPKMSPDMAKAAKLAKSENNKDFNVTKSLRDDQIRMAERLTKLGQYDAAKGVIEKTRDLFDQVSPGLADEMIKGYHAWIDEKRTAKEAKKRKPRMVKPKTEAEAKATVEQAVAAGTPEAIEEARPALEVLHPVADDAAKVADDLKTQAEAPAAEPAPAPVAPEPATVDPETEKAAQEERPQVSNGEQTFSHPSVTDWEATPLDASVAAASIWGDRKNLIALQDPALGGKVKAAVTKLAKRQNTPLGNKGEPAIQVVNQAQEILAENGATMDDFMEDRGRELDDFLKEKGLQPEDLRAAYLDSQATLNEQKHFIQAAAMLSGDPSPIQKARAETQVVLGSGLMMPNVADDVGNLIAGAGKQLAKLERISDETSRVEEFLATKPEYAQAHAGIRDLNRTIREMDSRSQATIAKLKAPIRAAVNDITAEWARPGYIEAVTDALEGKPSKLDAKQQALHDAIRAAFDATGSMYEEATGNPMRKDWAPRVELKGRVNAAVKGLNDQLGADSKAMKALEGEQMTVDLARQLPKEIKDLRAAEAIDNYTAELEKLFELKDGKVHLTQEDGRDLIDSNAAYLKLIDPDGELEPFLPEILERKRTPKDGKLEMSVVGKDPKHQRDWTPEDLHDLLRGEAIRLLSRRVDYDPDLPPKGTFAKRAGHWQADGSILYGRMMPYMGDGFYDRNAINIADMIISRQVQGLERIKTFGKDKSGLVAMLAQARGPLTDAQLGLQENVDGTLRIADASEKNPLYRNSLARSYEDVAMGYMRPFSEEGRGHKAMNAIGSASRSVVLMRRLLTTLNNEIAGLQGANNIGPEALAAYIAARTQVLGMQQESALRKAGARASKMVGLKKLSDNLLDNDPMTKADELAMTDAAMHLGATRAQRFFNQADQMGGSFALSTQGMSAAAHFVGQNIFQDLVYRRTLNPEAFAKEMGVTSETLARTMRESKLDEAAELLDSQGFPVSKEAAQKLIEIARPFVNEIKSKMVDANRPLYQPKAMRDRTFRGLMWMAMTPLALQVAAVADLQRAYRRIGRLSGLERKKAVAELLKRGALQQAGSLANATFKTMAASHAGTAALGAAIAMGAYPAWLAGMGAYGPYDPNEQTQDAKWAVLKGAYQDLWKAASNAAQDAKWAVLKGTYQDLWKAVSNAAWDSNTLSAAATLGRATMAGQIWLPRVGQSDFMTEQEARLAKLPSYAKSGFNAGDVALPQVGAMLQIGGQSFDAAKLAYSGGANGESIPTRSRISLAVAAAQPLLPLPSGKEYMGKDFPKWRREMRTMDAPTIQNRVLEKAGAMSRSSAPELIEQGVNNLVNEYVGSGHRD